jgi:D-sedoheptulose 7-phosphate isomerase
MRDFISSFSKKSIEAIEKLPKNEIAKALNILQATFERDGRVYAFGNGGSLALATHWVSDFNKTVFSHNLDKHTRRFQAIRVPTTDEEITAWANDVGFDMIFAGPLQNYLQDSDCIIAISSSGNSANIIKAVELAKSRHIPVIGVSGFDGGKLAELADAKIVVKTEKGEYELVEGVHDVVMHMMTKYFKNYFDELVARSKK